MCLFFGLVYTSNKHKYYFALSLLYTSNVNSNYHIMLRLGVK